MVHREEQSRRWRTRPMGRVREADEVAGIALLLASPAGSLINGQVIGVDGGASAW